MVMVKGYIKSIVMMRQNTSRGYLLVVSLLLASVNQAQLSGWSVEEETMQYWYDLGAEELQEALNHEAINTNVAKNVILFLGDGMGLASVTSGRILKGQMQNKSGEETQLAMDRFYFVGFSKTYSVDKQVADSASTATAYLCGVKSNYHTLGLSGAARVGDCPSQKGQEVQSILIDAHDAGKSTGLVTTTSITHATPAGAYAHSVERNWQSDADLPSDAVGQCKDIAQQFYDNSDKITVAMGGGRKFFYPNNTRDPEYRRNYGDREDNQNLVKMWQAKQLALGRNAKYVYKQSEFDDVDPVETDALLGLFQRNHMHFEVDRDRDQDGEPSLAEMTEKAIRILQKNSKGFFLLVEGGRIDHGHHATNAYTALHEVVAFDEAIAKAVQLTSDSDTMILVTADHSHTMSMGGYSDRGNPIFGLAPSDESPENAEDSKPYTTLLYGNGLGFQGLGSYIGPRVRKNLTEINTKKLVYLQQSAVPLGSETHAGDDVAIFARGPMSHLFHTVHEQSYIPHVIRYASCIGSIPNYCQSTGARTASVGSSESPSIASAVFLGMHLDDNEATIALYVQFAVVLTLAVFSLIFVFALSRRLSNERKADEKRTAAYMNQVVLDKL